MADNPFFTTFKSIPLSKELPEVGYTDSLGNNHIFGSNLFSGVLTFTDSEGNENNVLIATNTYQPKYTEESVFGNRLNNPTVILEKDNNSIVIHNTLKTSTMKNTLKQSLQQTAILLMNYLVNDKKLSPHKAAGIVGQITKESSLNFGSINLKDLGQASAGAILWSKDRLNNLKEYAKRNNKPWTDAHIQMDFLIEELKSKYPNLWNTLNSSNNPSDAAESLSGYIKYAGWNNQLSSAKKLRDSKGWTEQETLDYINKEHLTRKDYAEEVYSLWKALA